MEWTVSQSESGLRLQAFLKQKLGDAYSARQIKTALENNCCQVNSRTERFASIRLGTGDKVVWDPIEIAKREISTFDKTRILYQDEDFLIYDKPPFISSEDLNFPNLTLAHRLDKNTTGALIFAKNEFALSAIMDLFKKRLVQKTYLALVDSIPTKSFGKIDNYLGEIKRFEGQTIWGSVKKEKGLHAITEWHLEKIGDGVALLKCYPKTGRTHQIRVHMSEMGHPILGDFQYEKHFTSGFRPLRYLLHASEISFTNPKTGKEIHVLSPLPEDFVEAIEKLFNK